MTVDEFIAKWKPSGGNERANTQMFVTDLCELLDLPKPEPTQPDTGVNDYVFERHVIKDEIGGGTSNGWIDLYKRDCFILEAKQGSASDAQAVDSGLGESLRDLFGQTAADRFKRGMAKRGTGQWASAMQRAAGQAEGYAKALPKDHGWPPFLLASDVGYCIDIYANFALDGRSYAPFPDRRKFRIELDDLRDKEVRDRLRAVWLDPMTLDPSAEAARVTREVATHLAALAKDIETREQNPDRVAAFLMRLLFTMFAEDTGLIPKDSFSELLKRHREEPEILGRQVTSLWTDMDQGGHAAAIAKRVPQINGWLFKDRTFIELKSGEIDVLIEAAGADWKQVEPAIFGTLLERALNPRERAKLGAHYTPRAYVERLVQPTIMEPLREDWLGVKTAAMEAADTGDKDKARRLVEEFHGKLTRTKVLDPACGTGNFLYVAMARMKELEGEVLELLEELGDRQYLAEISGHTITPENFLGIEVNPRAAEIAQLVLWIGYLQWHFRVNGDNRMPEPPVLRDVKTIECRDALIEWDRTELERDESGRPVTLWDGKTMKQHAVTGKDVPDETARVDVYQYITPRAAKWPKADFVLGNPPFHGARTVRSNNLGGYIETVRAVYADVPENADFVMFWWHRAATAANKGAIRRFGFVTTNSIVQAFSREVIRQHLRGRSPVQLVFAVPDHPWVDEQDGAAVRIAMTVAEKANDSAERGKLLIVRDEENSPDEIFFEESVGRIASDLRIGVSVEGAKPLRANTKISSVGFQLTGKGFEVDQKLLSRLNEKELRFIHPLVNGRDILNHNFDRRVIDVCGVKDANRLRSDLPVIYQHIHSHVKPERDVNPRASVRENWWVYGEARNTYRPALVGTDWQIVTPITAKHRIFVRLTSETRPDSTCVCIALDDFFTLGVLTSRIHRAWENMVGSSLEDRPRYTKAECFDAFPFPDTADEGVKKCVSDAAKNLDALRNQVMERHPDLTLTKLYNVLDALRAAEVSGGTLGQKDRDVAERGCVSLIRQYHDEIDAAVAEAYGWRPNLSEEEILERLVALNRERAAEEARGKVRWLRPEFQAPGYVAPAEQAALALPEDKATADVLEWPAKLQEQVVAVAGIVKQAARPIAANDVARAFRGKRVSTVVPVLDALAGMGQLRKLKDGRFAA